MCQNYGRISFPGKVCTGDRRVGCALIKKHKRTDLAQSWNLYTKGPEGCSGCTVCFVVLSSDNCCCCVLDMSMSAVSGPTTTGSLSPDLLMHTQSNRFTITRPTHTYKATGSLSAELLINTQSNRFTITRPTHKYTEQQVHYQPTYSYIHRANYYTNTSVDYTKCTANKKGKGFPIPILVTERWARSRSRCTGSQPTSDCKSSTLL